MTERVAEFLVSDAGGVTLSVRPPLPFLSDGVRVTLAGVEVYGGAKRIALRAGRDLTLAIEEAGGLLLVEHASDGSAPPRELELIVEG
jgi:hypothetical protein